VVPVPSDQLGRLEQPGGAESLLGTGDGLSDYLRFTSGQFPPGGGRQQRATAHGAPTSFLIEVPDQFFGK